MPEEDLSPEDRQRFALQLGRLMDLAGHDNNSCLRAYYFGLAVMCWVGGNVAFVVATSLIALVLAEREFASGAVSCIRESEVDFVPLVSQGVASTKKN